jgi:hypothetical protein
LADVNAGHVESVDGGIGVIRSSIDLIGHPRPRTLMSLPMKMAWANVVRPRASETGMAAADHHKQQDPARRARAW